MTNSTDTYWDVDGTSLQTFAWNIATLGGGRDTVPGWRGTDRQFAYKAGAKHRAKVADSRVMTLAMWVVGMLDDGTVPPDMQIEYTENRRQLKRLLWKPDGAMFVLTKRWRETAGIIVASADGYVVSDMAPEMHGPKGSAFVVDVMLPDPWFYGPEVTTVLNVNTPTVIANAGDDVCTNITVELDGALTNPTVTNATPTPDVWFKVGSVISAGQEVVVDVDETTVVRTGDQANLIGSLTHSGARPWMLLQRGNNSLTLTADAGTGTATVRHRPAYF